MYIVRPLFFKYLFKSESILFRPDSVLDRINRSSAQIMQLIFSWWHVFFFLTRFLKYFFCFLISCLKFKLCDSCSSCFPKDSILSLLSMHALSNQILFFCWGIICCFVFILEACAVLIKKIVISNAMAVVGHF